MSSETPVNTAVGYAPLFVGRIPRAVMADAELQEMFRTKTIPGRFHTEGKLWFCEGIGT